MDNNLIEKAKAEIGKGSDVDKQKEQSSEFINQVFYNLKLIFPAWRQNFKTKKEFDATKMLWLNTLIDKKVTTQEQIDRALSAAKGSESAFFPSVGQFIKWSEKEACRVNEQAYSKYQHKLPAHTREEYQAMSKSGLDKIRKLRGK